MSRRRQLTDDEEALWTGITRSVKPLRPAKTKAKAADSARTTAAKPLPQCATKFHQVAAPPSPKKPPPLAPLDRREKKRVARGRDAIDARIDLHGMTQSEAHAALMGFIRRAQSNGARLVLVVTGKGSGTSRNSERGVLRRQVPLWLALPEFRSFVLGFDAAHVAHGGEGALYVRLRRDR